MTFLTILGVTDMICSFRLVIEGKTGIEIPESSRLEFLKKVSASNFALSDLPLLRTLLAICQKSHELSFWEVMDSFCFISICRFGSFKNPFVMITSPKNLLYWHKQKKGFYELWQASSWKPWRWVRLHLRLDLIRWGIYTSFQPDPLTKFTRSSRSTEFKDILP